MENLAKAKDYTFFAPQLTLLDVLAGVEFYKAAFGAVELRRFTNPDGSLHVAEMGIEGAIFHLHDERVHSGDLSPSTLKGTSVLMGLFVDDPAEMMRKAVAAGGRESSPVHDYDYGYRQGTVIDPAGHHWLLQKKI